MGLQSMGLQRVKHDLVTEKQVILWVGLCSSGCVYRVDGWYPNYGCSRYQLADGEVVEWRYTCDLGRDVGEDRLGQS